MFFLCVSVQLCCCRSSSSSSSSFHHFPLPGSTRILLAHYFYFGSSIVLRPSVFYCCCCCCCFCLLLLLPLCRPCQFHAAVSFPKLLARRRDWLAAAEWLRVPRCQMCLGMRGGGPGCCSWCWWWWMVPRRDREAETAAEHGRPGRERRLPGAWERLP